MSHKKDNNIRIGVYSKQKGCIICKQILEKHGFQIKMLQQQTKQKINGIFDMIIMDNQEGVPKEDSLIIMLTSTNLSAQSILALSSQLSTFGQSTTQFIPLHLIDFIIGISLSILILQLITNNQHLRKNTKVELDIVQMIRYYGAFNISAKENNMIQNNRANNLLDGGSPFYQIYNTKLGKLAVGNLQPKFYQEMVKGMKLSQTTHNFLINNQLNIQEWPKIRQILKKQFLKKQAIQWQTIFNSYDTCVTAVTNSSNFNSQRYYLSCITPLSISKL